MCLAQGPQRSDACEAQTRGFSVSRQALYHCAIALQGSNISGGNDCSSCSSSSSSSSSSRSSTTATITTYLLLFTTYLL